MSEVESFLARWSRLKREQAAGSTTSEASPREPNSEPTVAAPVAVDPVNLPSIESLGPGSDVSVFLSAGVPPELTQKALRAAWRTDPAIRDFVEVADNQWDFNAPEAMPGFGALGAAEHAAKLVSQALGVVGDQLGEDPATPVAAVAPADPVLTAGCSDEPRVFDAVWRPGATSPSCLEQSSTENAQAESPHGKSPAGARRHGSALPE